MIAVVIAIPGMLFDKVVIERFEDQIKHRGVKSTDLFRLRFAFCPRRESSYLRKS
jgi:hypothetical protein